MHLAVPSPSKARLSRLMIAGVAAVGAGLFALNAPTAGPLVQHHDVKLVDTTAPVEYDWAAFLSNTEESLSNLQTEGTASSALLSDALGNVNDHFSTQISTAITGFDTGVNNALFGGWYGGDDGYVFGIFGGTVTGGTTAISHGDPATETGSLISVLQADMQAGNSEQLYSDLNNYELEVLDHTMKPLLAPLLTETAKVTAADGTTTSVTNYSIPEELSVIQTNLLNQFGTYTELKGVAETVLSPEISAFFAYTQDMDAIQAAMTAGDSTTAMTDLNNLGSDVLNAFVNGWEPPAGAEGDLFPGLIGAGSFLDELYTTWTQQFITALGSLAVDSASAGASETASASITDLFSGLLAGL